MIIRVGLNGSPVYTSNFITSKLKGKKTSFKWNDSWSNEGTGMLKLYKNYVKIKVKVTKEADLNRSTLSTSGKYLKLKKTNNKKKLINY